MASARNEIVVRMGEQRASRSRSDVLVTIGLGSCIGLALVDARCGVVGLAHILLPDSGEAPGGGRVGKFADTAVPALLDLVLSLGATRSRTQAVIAGGARMFPLSGSPSSLEIGARNERATREALRRLRVPVCAAATGGGKGRTIRVVAADGTVAIKEAGGEETVVFDGATARSPAAPAQPEVTETHEGDEN